MSTWGYGKNNGPETWGDIFEAAKGQNQSPIDIISDITEFNENLTTDPLTLSFDKDSFKFQKMIFSGHNIKIDTMNQPLTVSGGPTDGSGPFKMVQYHFHWGKSDEDIGSEHLIDGKSWPSEMHMVHYNAGKYESFNEAVDKPDGLLVLGVLIEVGEKHDEIDKLMSPLSSVRSYQTVDLKEENIEINLENLLPSDTSRYYTYKGSLTTPPCYESVTWIVFENPIKISSDQLLQFRWIHMGDQCGTFETFRPVCPLNDRKISKSFE